MTTTGLESHRTILHLVLKNSSDLLQNVVLQYNAAEDAEETMKMISSALVSIISTLSQELIHFGQQAKEIIGREAKLINCIKTLRSCVEKQKVEIFQLKSAASIINTTVATDTFELERLEEAKIQFITKEVTSYKRRLAETSKKCESVTVENRRLEKALNKSILMLRTQQALLEAYDRDDHEPQYTQSTKPSHPTITRRQQYQPDITYDQSWEKEVDDEDRDIYSMHVMSITSLPPDRRAVRYFPQQFDESVQTSNESLHDIDVVEKSDSSPVKDEKPANDLASPTSQQDHILQNESMISRMSDESEQKVEMLSNSFVSEIESSHYRSAELTMSQSQLNASTMTANSQDSFAVIMGCYDQYFAAQNAGIESQEKHEVQNSCDET